MKTVILLGELGKRFGRKHLLDVASPAEAIRALCANFREFREFVSRSAERNVAYRVLNRREDVAADELHNPASQSIMLVPVVGGASFWTKYRKIIIGAALIGAAFATGGASLTIGMFTGIPSLAVTALGSMAIGVGASLILGGVAELLAPVPKSKDAARDESFTFNGAVNTTAQGQTIPVGYGRLIVGSAVISAGISVEDIST